MPQNANIFTTIFTALATSGLTTWVVDHVLNSKTRARSKELQKEYEICGNFCSYIENCQSNGSTFWAKNRKELPPELAAAVLFSQTRAEGAYLQLKSIGYDDVISVIELFELLTGGDYDDEERPANPKIATNIATKAAEICTNVDNFKNSL